MQDNQEVTLSCNVEYVLAKEVQIHTKDCSVTYMGKDEDGYDDFDYDASGVDFEKEFGNEHMSILELLNELKSFAESELSCTGKDTSKGQYLQRLISECNGWQVMEANFTQV